MKDTEIHNGLDKKEIRDFLSESIVKVYNKEIDNRKEYDFNGLSGLDISIKRLKIQIHNNENELNKLNTLKAVLTLSKNFNWEEWDVSDFVEKTDKRLCRNFFGTEEEYNNFMIENNLKK